MQYGMVKHFWKPFEVDTFWLSDKLLLSIRVEQKSFFYGALKPKWIRNTFLVFHHKSLAQR